MSEGTSEAGDDPAGTPSARFGVWVLAILPAALLAILLQRPIWDVDIFWQLRLGEMILAHGGPIAREPFAVTHLGEPLAAFAWLGQAVMAEVRLLGGWTGLRIFDALLWLGGFLAVAAACRRRGASAAGVATGLGIAFYIAFPTASIRPQTFAVLCFGLLLAVLRLELRPWRTAALVVPLLVLWQNLHPSVSVAAVVLGCHAAAGWLRWLSRRAAAPPWETSLLTLAAGAAMLATPDGWSGIATAGANARASAGMGVTEWLPIWDSSNLGGIAPLAVGVAVAGLLLVRDPRRGDLGELAVALALLGMTAFATRFVLFWAMALIPVIARAARMPAAERRLPAAITPILLLAVAAFVPLARPTYFSDAIPLGAIGKLREAGVRGTVFTHIPWGGPAIDAGYPDWRVAYDGRFYRYTPAELDFYRAIARDKVPLAEVLRRYDPAAFVLDPEWNGSLIAELRRDPQWQLVSADKVAVAFKRRPGAPR